LRIPRFFLFALTVILAFTACSEQLPELTPEQALAADTLGIDQEKLRELLAKPLYEFDERDVDIYLPWLQYSIPDLQERIKHLARKNLGQPYDIYLLGEYPVEIYDDQPLFNVKESDCVVFVEHTVSMALAHDWQSFFAILQRLRYKDGIIGYATRNHYGEYDWPENNTWLSENISEQLAGDRVGIDTIKVNKGDFFKKRNVPYYLPEDSLIWTYVPIELMPEIFSRLQTGDIVNVVRGYKNNKWVGHYGFVMVNEDGSVNFLHSTVPEVKEQDFPELVETLMAANAEKAEINAEIELVNAEIKDYNELYPDDVQTFEPYLTQTLGYRFLRIHHEPLKNIMEEGQELRLQVVPVRTGAIKTTRQDSVLMGLL
jgi:hypothetical protein